MKITRKQFGKVDGLDVSLFILENENGLKVNITNYGAIITAIEAPDKNGKLDNIVCGFDKLEDYLSEEYLSSYPYFGCILGRCANRIAKGKYSIDGQAYAGVVNNGENHLHGGAIGFDRKLWDATLIEESNSVGIKLSYLSPDGEEAYPGNLKVSCTYTLNANNELKIAYEATTDKKTIVNISNHSYFNLTAGAQDVMKHSLELTASKYTESVEAIPTGEILPVAGTPFDFTKKKTLGEELASLPEGYDLNMVLDNQQGDLAYAGCLSEQTSGRTVEVYTTQPGIQVYTGYWIPELKVDGKAKFGKFAGVALETQHYPDSPNHDNFPSVELVPNEKYNEITIYKFGVE